MKKVQERLADSMMSGKAFKVAHIVFSVFIVIVVLVCLIP